MKFIFAIVFLALLSGVALGETTLEKPVYNSCFQTCKTNSANYPVIDTYCDQMCHCVNDELKPMVDLSQNDPKIMQQVGSTQFGPKVIEATKTCQARNLYIVADYLKAHPEAAANPVKQQSPRTIFYDNCTKPCFSDSTVAPFANTYCPKMCQCIMEKSGITDKTTNYDLLQNMNSQQFGPKVKNAALMCRESTKYIIINYFKQHPQALEKLRKQQTVKTKSMQA